jgi:uncharacterized protein
MKSIRGIAATATLALAVACAGPSREHRLTLNASLANRNWSAAVQQLESTKSSYGDKNAVLYWLDEGEVLQEGGRYAESDQTLDLAEQRLDELYTQSISKAAGTFLLNDNTDDYRGEPHERSLLHILRALNHAYLGSTDEAVVESRKVSAFLADLTTHVSQRYVYRDDAFAEYLSALLFEDAGRGDDARISYQAAHAAYGWYVSAYGTPEPVFDVGKPAPGEGEIVFLHYVGVAPRRESRSIQVAWNDAVAAISSTHDDEDGAKAMQAISAGLSGNAITVAFPEYVQDDFRISDSEIDVAGRRVHSQLVEDISAISRQALADRTTAIRSRAIARATIKFVLAKIAEEETKKQAGQGWGMLAGFVARTVSAATEIADTRCWSTLPAQIRMARVRAPAGRQVIEVKYFSDQGVVQTETLDVDVKPGKRTYVHVRTAS